ncbi:hypothetical protein LCGC14_0933830 [marine sediment metagenome]|uniref:Right handed beta helix domain-containing protein n=1 Tax=marine sediment metagenome TaxID=412755 RepID=A0A0F9NM52_9ZZZZ
MITGRRPPVSNHAADGLIIRGAVGLLRPVIRNRVAQTALPVLVHNRTTHGHEVIRMNRHVLSCARQRPNAVSQLVKPTIFNSVVNRVVTGGTASNNPIDNTVEYCRFNQLTDGIRALPGTTQDMSIHANNFMAVSGSIVNENGQGGLRNSITDNWAQEADSAAYNQAVGSMITDGWTPSGNHYVES